MNATRGESLKGYIIRTAIAAETRLGAVLIIVAIGCDGSRLSAGLVQTLF